MKTKATIRTAAEISIWKFQISNHRSGERAFTMVEIALCLGIIAFAMVAIMGVLPTGIKVQKENREETIINADGMFLLEAIRGAARGSDDLTNYVDYLEVNYDMRLRGTIVSGSDLKRFGTVGSVFGNFMPRFTNGQHVIGLLGTPTVVRMADGSFQTNSVKAYLRPFTGNAGTDKSGRSSSNEFAFRYQVRTEVMPFVSLPPGLSAATTNDVLVATNMLRNLYELRVTLNWPLYLHGADWKVGRNRKTFRTLVSGELRRSNPLDPRPKFSTFVFEPQTFTSTF